MRDSTLTGRYACRTRLKRGFMQRLGSIGFTKINTQPAKAAGFKAQRHTLKNTTKEATSR